MMAVFSRRAPARRVGRARAAALLLAALFSAPAQAGEETPLHAALDLPDALVLKVNLRARIEAVGGQFRPTAARSDRLLSFRTDVFAEYSAGRLILTGQFRDARGYLEEDNSSAGVGEINTLEPIQASIGLNLKDIGGKGASGRLAVGRYTLEVGAGRLIGRPDFANSVNSYTGLLLDWRGANKDRLIAFAAEPSLRLPNDLEGLHENHQKFDRATKDLLFFGASYTRAALFRDVLGEAYVFRLSERDGPKMPTRNRRLTTYGVRIQRAPKPGRMDFEVEAAHQTGSAHASSAATDRRALPVSAQLVHVEVGRKMKGGWTPRVVLHADLATGDDADPNRFTRFDPLFGAARADFGPTGLYGPINRTNLRSVGVRIEATPSKRLEGFVMAREVWLDSLTDAFSMTQVRDRAGRSGRHGGAQVETRVRYWLKPKMLKLDVGGAYLAKGRFLRDAPNAPPTGDTRYLFIDLSADF